MYYNYYDEAYSYQWYNYSVTNQYRGTYWETNQPRPYWDTQLCDDNDERSFCVGCSDANQFEANSLYYWWGYGIKNSDGSMAKIATQRGHRFPSYEYDDTLSVFAEETVKVVNFSEWTTPSSIEWTY